MDKKVVASKNPESNKAQSVQVHGHRGSRGTHTENTFPSFEAAAQAGSDYIELDVQLSKDDVPIVYHDASFSGRHCLNIDGSILKHPLAIREHPGKIAKNFFCGSYVHPRFPEQVLPLGAQIPFLEEVFEWRVSGGFNVGLNIELKLRPYSYTPPTDPIAFAGVVASMVKKYDAYDWIIIQSFEAAVLDEIRRIDPKIFCSRLFNKDESFFEKTIESEYKSVTLHRSLLSPEAIRALHKLGLKVLTYTVNSERGWKRALECRVDGIITDFPKALRAYLQDK